MYFTYVGYVIQFLAITEIDYLWNRNDTTEYTEAKGDDYIDELLVHTFLLSEPTLKSQAQ